MDELNAAGFIVASALTDSSVHDASIGISMIEKVALMEVLIATAVPRVAVLYQLLSARWQQGQR